MTSNLNLQRETLNDLTALAERAASASGKLAIIPVPNSPTNRYLIVQPNGDYVDEEPPLAPRSTALQSVDQVGLFALHARDRLGCEPVIYYSPGGVETSLCDGSMDLHRERSVCPLKATKVWSLLNAWQEKPDSAWKQHREFIRELRVTFGDSFGPGVLDRLLDSIGQLDFIQGERAQSVAVRNRESMGREVASEVKSLKGDIPEEVLLSVRIYRDPVLLRRHSIRCLLETDPQNGRLALIPLAGQLDEALDIEMSGLGDMLRSSVGSSRRLTGPDSETTEEEAAAEWSIPVFYGQP
jgi:hypothetical protein